MKIQGMVTGGGVVGRVTTLTFGATVATDVTTCNLFQIVVPTSGSDFTLSNPLAAGATPGSDYDMAIFVWKINQATDTARTMTLDTKFRFGEDITSVALTTSLGKASYLAVRYDSTDDKFDVVSFVKGY